MKKSARSIVAMLLIAILVMTAGCSNTAPAAATTAPASTTAAPAATTKAATEKPKSDYPKKAITSYVAYSAGGGTDTGMRTLAPFLQKYLGQPVVVENKTGSSGVVGSTAIAKANKDGYEVGVLNLPALVANDVSGFLSFKPLEAFEIIGCYNLPNSVIVVKKDSKFQTMADMTKFLKENPEGVTIAVTGKVSSDALTAMAYETAAGVKVRLVSFDGAPESIAAIMGGHIDATVLSQDEFAPYNDSGELHPLGIGGSERLKALPDVPTFKEQGLDMPLKGEAHILALPAGCDPAIVETLRTALKKTVEDPAFIAQAQKVGMLEPVFVDAETIKKEIQTQTEWLKTLDLK